MHQTGDHPFHRLHEQSLKIMIVVSRDRGCALKRWRMRHYPIRHNSLNSEIYIKNGKIKVELQIFPRELQWGRIKTAVMFLLVPGCRWFTVTFCPGDGCHWHNKSEEIKKTLQLIEAEQESLNWDTISGDRNMENIICSPKLSSSYLCLMNVNENCIQPCPHPKPTTTRPTTAGQQWWNASEPAPGGDTTIRSPFLQSPNTSTKSSVPECSLQFLYFGQRVRKGCDSRHPDCPEGNERSRSGGEHGFGYIPRTGV